MRIRACCVTSVLLLKHGLLDLPTMSWFFPPSCLLPWYCIRRPMMIGVLAVKMIADLTMSWLLDPFKRCICSRCTGTNMLGFEQV